MSMLPIDIQANYGNLEIAVKEVNKIHDLSEQINYNSSITVEKFAKEIYEKIVEVEEFTEQQKIEDRKKQEERKNRKNKQKKKYYMTKEQMKKKLELSRIEPYKGTFINLYK